MAPPRPPVDAPLPKNKEPLSLPDDVPELNMRRPLIPADPAFGELSKIEPLEENLQLPDLRSTSPPVYLNVTPPLTVTLPPPPESPLPT